MSVMFQDERIRLAQSPEIQAHHRASVDIDPAHSERQESFTVGLASGIIAGVFVAKVAFDMISDSLFDRRSGMEQTLLARGDQRDA